MSELTQRQHARQKAREKTGRYSKMHRCEVCGKPLGTGYYSDERCNTHGYGLLLCKKHAREVAAIPDSEYDAFFERIEAERKLKEATGSG